MPSIHDSLADMIPDDPHEDLDRGLTIIFRAVLIPYFALTAVALLIVLGPIWLVGWAARKASELRAWSAQRSTDVAPPR